MLNERKVEAMSKRAHKALEGIPGIRGAVLLVRDPDGPGDAEPTSAVAIVEEADLHATGHILQALAADFRRKPDGLGDQVREMLDEGIDRWAAGLADDVETVIKQRVAQGPGPALRATMDLMTPEDRAIADRIDALAAVAVPDLLRTVAARHIALVREAWDLEAEVTAASVATFMWDKATANTCAGDK